MDWNQEGVPLPGRGPNDCGPNQGGCSHGVAGNGSGRSNLGDISNAGSGEGWTTQARALELARASPTGTYAFYPSRSQLDAERAAHPGGGGGGSDDGGGGYESLGSAEIPGGNPFEREEEVEAVNLDDYFNPGNDDSIIKEFISQNNDGGGQNLAQYNGNSNSTFAANAPQKSNQSDNYSLDLKKRSEAKERAKDWLALSAVAG